MDPAEGPAAIGWIAPTERSRSRWVWTAFIGAILWVVFGCAVAFLSAMAGAPTASGWLALLTGLVTLVLVGRRVGLNGRRDWILAGLLEFGFVLVFGSAALYFAVLSGIFGGSGGSSSVESVAFGTGGTDCDLTTIASTFAPADPVRAVAEFTPELPAGTTVTIWLTLDGQILESTRETVTLDTSAECVNGRISDAPLAVGHYRWDISPDAAPAIGAEFDVAN